MVGEGVDWSAAEGGTQLGPAMKKKLKELVSSLNLFFCFYVRFRV